MKKYSLTTVIIFIVFILVAVVRFYWICPVVAIILFVSVFRLVRSILNQDREDKTVGQKAKQEDTKAHNQKSVDTIITCDYCGSKLDTSKHAVCNHCGGPYWNDEEWKNIRNRKVG